MFKSHVQCEQANEYAVSACRLPLNRDQEPAQALALVAKQPVLVLHSSAGLLAATQKPKCNLNVLTALLKYRVEYNMY